MANGRVPFSLPGRGTTSRFHMMRYVMGETNLEFLLAHHRFGSVEPSNEKSMVYLAYPWLLDVA